MPRVRLTTVNDNMGAVIPSQDASGTIGFGRDTSALSGNDVGHTAGFALSAEWMGRDTSLRLGLNADLFTQATARGWVRADGRQLSVQKAVDLTALQAAVALAHGPVFATKLSAELGVRNSGVMMKVQYAWHSLIPAYVMEHEHGPASVYAGGSAAERAELRLGSLQDLRLTMGAELGVRVWSVADSAQTYSKVDVSAKLGVITLDAAHELSVSPRGVANKTTLGLTLAFEATELSLQAARRSGAFNTALAQYDEDDDLLLSVGVGF